MNHSVFGFIASVFSNSLRFLLDASCGVKPFSAQKLGFDIDSLSRFLISSGFPIGKIQKNKQKPSANQGTYKTADESKPLVQVLRSDKNDHETLGSARLWCGM